KILPFYDRTTLVAVTTSTVLHNLVFGCLLIFFIQWLFLGDLRSAIIVGANIPFALFFSIIILVLRNEDANLLSVGAVDFGIIVAAFIPLFTMSGVEGQIFGPMARTYAYALLGALIATFTVTPCLASLLLPRHISEIETTTVRAIRSIYTPMLRWSLRYRKIT